LEILLITPELSPVGTRKVHMNSKLTPLTYRGKEVDAILGISKSTRYSWQDVNSPQYDPTWPVPIKLSARSTGYIVQEVEAWLASRPRNRAIKQAEGA
jgi:prophage regulatory protein